ncbi:MAG: ABC transporter permease [Clostridiales bacterium]|jgi:ABC-2 type transport system permease protein|nr:ABC transporter permease [Clostridiales bacterium]
MKQLKTIFDFEFGNYAKRKSFLILTIGLMLIVAVVLSWPRISELFAKEQISGTGGDTAAERVQIALIDESGGQSDAALYFNAVPALGKYRFVSLNISVSEAEKKVESGEYNSAIVLTGPLVYTRIARNIPMNDSFAYTFENALLTRYRQQRLAAYGVSEADADTILNAFVTGTVKMTSEGKDQMQNFFYTYILIFLLYFAIIVYGQMVASSVATEKSSRAMELLITSANPKSLMFGKVLGASLAGMLQLVLVLGTAYLFYNLNAPYYTDSAIVQSIFAMPISMLLYTLLFFILGFLLYAFLYASLASLVSRMEELSTIVLPVTFLFVIAFMVVMFSMSGGKVDSPLMVLCSFIPFTSPMAMFTRIAMGEVVAWQITASIAILIISTIGVGILAAKIYRLGVLLYGTPPKPNQILRMLKADKAQLR